MSILNRLARVAALFVLFAGLSACTTSEAKLPEVTVYKSPTCGCCSAWVGHLKASGFEVKAVDTSDMRSVKERLGVPAALTSCHTAVADGYVFEGHVPAEVMQRFLKEQPEVVGLAVPGMPIGSPGMVVPGRAPQPYEVVAFAPDSTYVYAQR